MSPSSAAPIVAVPNSHPNAAPVRPLYSSTAPSSGSSTPTSTPAARKTVRFQTVHAHADDAVRRSSSSNGNGDGNSNGSCTSTSSSVGVSSLSVGKAAQKERHDIGSIFEGAAAIAIPPHSTSTTTNVATAASFTTTSSHAGHTSHTSHTTHTGHADHASHASSSLHPPTNGDDTGGSSSSSANWRRNNTVARPTLLQPRVAVVLGVPGRWHLPLFACRLLSVAPAIWWSLGILIRLLIQLHALVLAHSSYGDSEGKAGIGGSSNGGSGHGLSLESRLKLTETALAMIWCAASAYLSFFFTDCLMSRWLLNYTPQATIVRLLAINALNGYLTSWVIYLAGSGGDSRLLLPAWVSIAATLTALYHVTQRKINIRKETSISISVFSGASFISMVSLLAQLYWDRPEYADVPVVSIAHCVCTEFARIAGNLFDIGNITMDL